MASVLCCSGQGIYFPFLSGADPSFHTVLVTCNHLAPLQIFLLPHRKDGQPPRSRVPHGLWTGVSVLREWAVRYFSHTLTALFILRLVWIFRRPLTPSCICTTAEESQGLEEACKGKSVFLYLIFMPLQAMLSLFQAFTILNCMHNRPLSLPRLVRDVWNDHK